ncbi:MAG: MmgE/PrpD family protein [Pseudomonadota bacterium]
METEIIEHFARFIRETRYEGLSHGVVHQAKRSIFDFVGVALAGGKVGLAPLLSDIICGLGGKEEATVIGDGRRLPAIQAALVNGVLGHTLDMDDGHRYANAHPGVVIIPAALAVGEQANVAGRDLIESVVVGYETFIRIAKTVNPSHLWRGFHTTGTVGPFGSAAACSKLLDLGEKEIKNAMAIAGLQGAGLLEVTKSGQMIKPLHPGKAAQAGVLASLLAKKGAEGPDFILEGEKGFFRAFSDTKDFQSGVTSLGDDFEILKTYFKMHAACRHVHPALDAVLEIMNENKIAVGDIKGIHVRTYSVAYSLTGQTREAGTEPAAKFSLPVSVGLMVVYGRAVVDEYTPECIQNPLVKGIADKVTITVDAQMDAVYPSKRSACVTMETEDGVLTHEVAIPRGDAENPWTEDELKDKFLLNAQKVLSQGKANRLHESILNIETRALREVMGQVY